MGVLESTLLDTRNIQPVLLTLQRYEILTTIKHKLPNIFNVNYFRLETYAV
jgi:hypothetical protein